MIEFKMDSYGQIHFFPDKVVTDKLAMKLVETEDVLRLAEDKGGLQLPGPVGTLARHPFAHLLTAYRSGLIGSDELGDTPLELAQLSESNIADLDTGRLLLVQRLGLLPSQEARGQSFALVSVDGPAETQFRNSLDRLLTSLGSSWAAFIGILRTITFVDVPSMPGLPYFSGSSNVSFGAMHMVYSENQSILAECITHEAAHTWLSLLDSQDELACDMWSEAKPWISPWREDLRPIGGIVHGVFVFSCVIVVLSKLLKQTSAPNLAESVRRRLSRIASQLEEGVSVLRESGLLTEAGKELCLKSEARLLAAIPLIADEWEEARSFTRTAYLRKKASLRGLSENSYEFT